MTTAANQPTPTSRTEPADPLAIVITRVFSAPRALVWQALTQPEHVAAWWGPRGFTATVEKLDLRPGGEWRYVMHSPDGKHFPATGVFSDVVPPERYTTSDDFDDEFRQVHGGDLPGTIVTTYALDDLGDGLTKLTITMVHESLEDRAKHLRLGVEGGWNSSLDCLAEHVAAMAGDGVDLERDMVVRRTVAAPADAVFAAWSDPQAIVQWWGPDGFTTTTSEWDFRPGGRWRYTMHGPDGADYPNLVEFDEIKTNRRIAYRHSGEGDHDDVKFRTVVTFEETKFGTETTLRSRFASRAERERVEEKYHALEGGRQTLGRLCQQVEPRPSLDNRFLITLPSDEEVRITRVLAAPRELVFEAMTKAEHVRNWWGCGAFEMTVCEMDVRVGGQWRYVQREPGGREHPFKGEYLQIVAPERLVYTFVYDVDMIRDFPAVETIELEERDGLTIATCTVKHLNRESRDGHLYSGMDSGARESMNRLETLLESLGA
ncbi:MAG: SRPBCC domain-containing protein [Pirellulales bacterium]|nr:SRPBCC domain-containing protein [Pirellulales bacterium]